MTQKIVLDLNLKYIIEALTLTERGELLTALFNQGYQGSDLTIKSVYQYVATLQDEHEKKRLHMKDISLKGVAARLKNHALGDRTVDRRLKRKVTKENDINIDNKDENSLSYLFLLNKEGQENFMAPSLNEVSLYIKENNLDVNAETFVDFYGKRGWRVGKKQMYSWQSMLKLWHERALKKTQKNTSDDEGYWHQLAQKFAPQTPNFHTNDILREPNSFSIRQNLNLNNTDVDLDLDEKPFTRFMKRVEKYDIQSENKHDGKQ